MATRVRMNNLGGGEASSGASGWEDHRLTLLESLTRQSVGDPPLEAIIEVAVSALRVRTGGIYALSPDGDELTLIAVSRGEQHKGRTLKVGEGMSGRLAQGQLPYMIIDDYDRWPERAPTYGDVSGFGAVLDMPVRWQGKVIGCFYVNDRVGRSFGVEDIAFLASAAAMSALILAGLAEREETNLKRLQRLCSATRMVMQNLAGTRLDDRLNLIAYEATKILAAESCGVFLVRQKGFLTLEASYGHRPGGFKKGRKLKIHDRPRGGLTGWITFHGQTFNAHGKDLKAHPAVRRRREPKPYHTESKECYSLLAIPLKPERKSSTDGSSAADLVGLLRVDNKRDSSGQPRPDLRFTKEDEWVLRIFAEEVAIALESAELVRELVVQKDSMRRLVDSSPIGIISINLQEEVTEFNQTAERVLGYTRDEALGQPVRRFYVDENSPRQIGRALHGRGGSVRDYDSAVRHSEGQAIPIKISATWLFDANGERVGSAGYFEDLRDIRLLENRQQVLIRASNLVVEAEELEDGLQKLAEMLVGLLPHTFCRILLMDEGQRALRVAAASFSPSAGGPESWEPGCGTRLQIDEWSGLRRILDGGHLRVIRNTARSSGSLDRLAHRLGLERPIQSLLLVPCLARGRATALLEVGELGSERRHPFTTGEQSFAAAIAAHTSMLIDRRLMHRVTEEQKNGLELLQRSVESMALEEDPRRLLRVIGETAASMTGAEGALVLPYDKQQEAFVDDGLVAHGVPEDAVTALRQAETRRRGSAPAALDLGWLYVPDLEARRVAPFQRLTRTILRQAGLRSAVALPLAAGGEPVAVLYLFYARPLARPEQQRLLLERFGSSAALAFKRARLAEQITRATRFATVLAEVMTLGGEVGEILDLVAVNTRIGVGCHAVTLFPFDPGSGQLMPPRHDGLRDKTILEDEGERDSRPLIRQVLRLQEPLFIEDVPSNKLTRSSVFAEREGIRSCAAVPLASGGRGVGVLFVNYRSPHHFSSAEKESIGLFANHAAIAIQNAQLYGEVLRKQKALDALYEGSQAINTRQSLEAMLRELVQRAKRLANGDGTRLCEGYAVLSGRGKLDVVAATSEGLLTMLRQWAARYDLRKRGGIVDRAVLTRKIQNVPDVRVDPDYCRIAAWARSQLSVPMLDRGEVIGVLTIEHEEPAAFSREDEENFESLATQAAAAIQSTERLGELVDLHRAAWAISRAVKLDTVGTAIVEQGRKLFDAVIAVLWPYDARRRQFLLEGPQAAGLSADDLAAARRVHPRPGQLRFSALEQGWVGLADLSASSPESLGRAARGLLRRHGIRSLQAVRLKAGSEKVGVLLLGYGRTQEFTDKQRKQLETFANYAALTLKKARLADEAKRRNVIGEILAKVSAVGDTDGTLTAVLSMAPVATACDVVRLYLRNPVTRAFEICYLEGGKGPRSLIRVPVQRPAMLQRLLRLEHRHVVDRASRRRAVVSWPAEDDRRLEAWVALPMIAAQQPIGVFFVGYREPQHFQHDHLAAMGLLANQTAVAIANNYLYRQSQRRADRFNALYSAGHAITRSLGLEETLEEIADQALEIVGTRPGEKGSLAFVALVEEDRFKIAAASPRPRLAMLGPALRKLCLDQPADKNGIVGRAYRLKKSVLVSDVREQLDSISIDPDTRSQLVVPVKFEDRVIGVIGVEKPSVAAFSMEQVRYIELLGAQAAVAIENARRYSELKQTKGLVGTRTVLAWTNLLASVWRHDIEVDAVTIRNVAEMLEGDIGELPGGDGLTAEAKRIQRLASRILKHPIVPPLDAESGRASLRINDMVTDWSRRLWRGEPYAGIKTALDLSLESQDSTHASAEWLRRAFEYLMQNAAQAVAHRHRKSIKISTWRDGQLAHIDVQDNGTGIPPRVLTKLFQEPIRKAGKDGGLGVGLLLAQVIAQAYEGDVACAATGPRGTRMRLSLRLE